jgi:endoglucanase
VGHIPSPVARHGQLRVEGSRVLDAHGKAVQLRGMSFYWSCLKGGWEFWNADVVNWLADDWQISIVRAAMGVEDFGGYLDGDTPGSGRSNKDHLFDLVDAAIAKGIYVIIDWHSHNAHLYTNEAKAFFEEMALKYKSVPNVLYGIYNEPLGPLEESPGYAWDTDIKPYSQTIVDAIRAIDPDNIIIVGTPCWSQAVDTATDDPVEGKNLMYALHFYAASEFHKQELRDKGIAALNNGKAVIVSEFGTCNHDGDVPYDFDEADIWLDFLDQNKISWCNWSVHDLSEAASILMPGASKNGNWTDEDLTESGRYIRNRLITYSPIGFCAR